MAISVNSGLVNRGMTDSSQNKASEAKSKTDKDKTIQNKKKSSKAHDSDSKDHQKLLKSLYVSRSEIAKNFGLAGKSLLGSKPILAPWKEKQDTTHAKDFHDDSNTSSTEDESQSMNKSSTRTPSTSNTVTSNRKNITGKSSTSSKEAQNQDNKNISKNKASTATKGTHSKTINPEAKVSKATSEGMSTQEEMDTLIESAIEIVTKFQTRMEKKESKLFNTKGSLKGKSKNSKSASSTSSLDHENNSLSNKSKSELANKSNFQETSEFNDLHSTKAKNFSSSSSMTNDNQTDSKDNTKHLDKNIPTHILNAVKRSMALKGNIHNIVNNASLQSLIARYLDTRGSYAIKIMIAMEKLKAIKNKAATNQLTDTQKTRQLASDRQIKETKKVQEMQQKMTSLNKNMGILGIVMASLAILISIFVMVGTGGVAAPMVIAGIVGIVAGVVALGISSGNFVTKTVEGRTMGSFDACIYKSYRSQNYSQKKAREATRYTGIGIQVGLLLVSVGAMVGASMRFGSSLANALDKIGSFVSRGSIKNLSEILFNFFDASAAQVELGASYVKNAVMLGQGIMGLTEATLMGIKATVEYKMTDLQAKVTQIQGIFEKIEQHEHIAHTLLQNSIKRSSQAAASVVKTLDAEYQAIKLLNMRSKVA